MNKVVPLYMLVTMDDGSVWQIPVWLIAENRALHFAHEFNNDVHQSLAQDTLPLFAEDKYEIKDWAENMMKWEDVEAYAVCKFSAQPPDFEDDWVNGDKEFVYESE